MARLRTDRQTGNFAYHLLSLRDAICLESDIPMKFPIETTAKDRLRSREDFQRAYEENRGMLLAPRSRSNPAGHHPGSRSWLFWTFEHGLPETPREQVLALHELHLLCQAERKELAEWLRVYSFRYSAREKKLIESWRDGPPAEGATIVDFPTDDREPDDSE